MLRSRLLKLHKEFDPVLAYSYGKKTSAPNEKKIYREVAGQLFWEEITGDFRILHQIDHPDAGYSKTTHGEIQVKI